MRALATSLVTLPPALERFLAVEVKRGGYPSRAAAIVAAVSGEKSRVEQRSLLQAQLQKGLDSGSAGELKIVDIIQRGRMRLAAWKRRIGP